MIQAGRLSGLVLMGDICSSLLKVNTYSLLSIRSLDKSVGDDDHDNDDDDDDDEDDGGGNVYRGCDVSPAGLAPREQPIIIQMLSPSLYHGLLLATCYNTSSIIHLIRIYEYLPLSSPLSLSSA